MGTKKDSGFTIIELMLFLAVSAALLVGVLIGTGTTINNARFIDSLKGIESFVQRQYEEVINGVNTRTASNVCGAATPSTPGASNNCLLLGKAIAFTPDQSQVRTYYVTGTVPPGTLPPGLNMSQIISLYNPQIVKTGGERYDLPWAARFFGGRRISSGDTDTIAYLRSPVSAQTETYIYRAVPKDADGDIISFTLGAAVVAFSSTTNRDAAFCIDGADGMPNQYRGALTITAGQGASTISSRSLIPSEWTPLC